MGVEGEEPEGLRAPRAWIRPALFGELLGFPSVFFILAAGLAWDFPVALCMAWLGSIVLALVVFLVSRYLVRDFVQVRLSDRVRNLDARLERGGVRAVAILRRVVFLAPWTHHVLAMSSVTIRAYAVGTAIGVLPGVLALVYFGDAIASRFERIPGWVWAVVLALIVLHLARVQIRNRRERA